MNKTHISADDLFLASRFSAEKNNEQKPETQTYLYVFSSILKKKTQIYSKEMQFYN